MFNVARRCSLTLLLTAGSLTVLGVDGVDARQKAPKVTPMPTVAEFGVNSAIAGDGLGPYFDGQDGVSSYRVTGSGTTNGWAFDLAAKRTTAPRQLIYDLRTAVEGEPQGVLSVSNTHGQVYDLSSIPVGESRHVRAAFHLIINRVIYVLRYGQTPGDGSSPLQATRVSDSQFHVVTGSQGSLARFLRGNGPGEVVLGIYDVPLDLILGNQ